MTVRIILPRLNDCFESVTLLSSVPGQEMIKVCQLAPVSPTQPHPVEYIVMRSCFNSKLNIKIEKNNLPDLNSRVF